MLLAEIEDQSGVDAGESYLKILTIYPKFDMARKLLAARYLRDPSRIDEAEGLVNEARRRLPNASDLTGLLGMINFRKGNHQAALQLLSEVATQRSLRASELFILGMCQTALKRNEDARTSLRQAIEAGLVEPEATEAKAALEALGKEDE